MTDAVCSPPTRALNSAPVPLLVEKAAWRHRSCLLVRPGSRSSIILTMLAVASHCLEVGGIGRSR